MSAPSASLAVVVGLAAVFLGCDSPGRQTATTGTAVGSASTSSVPATPASAASASGTTASTPRRRARPLAVNEPDATTSPDIARRNFESQQVELARLLEARPDDLSIVSAAVSAELDRVTFFGQMGGIGRALELAERAVTAHPKDPKAYFLRSSARSLIHEFAAARADLDEAQRVGADASELASKRAVLAMALGDYDAAEPVFAADVKRFPNVSSLGLHATCLGHMGRTDDAERAFLAAEQAFRDVSPFMLAWLYFHRAEMWDKAGKPELARDLYTIAVERLPFFARGAIHLSELLPAAEGKPYLDAVASGADDPEVSSALYHTAEALTPGSGKAHLDKAAAGYDALMAKFPKAFADHAAEFHLGATKDPKKALAATTLNLENRKTAESYVLHLEALEASGDAKGACAAADEAGAFRYPTSKLRELRTKAYVACGKKPPAEPAPRR